MRTRITYLVDDAEGDVPIEIADDKSRIKLSGVQGAKHVRVIIPGGRPGNSEEPLLLYLSWTDEIHLATLFDPPVEKGLHIDTFPETNWSSLLPWLAQCGITLDPSEIVHAPNWDSYTSLDQPSFACLKEYGIQSGAYAIKISTGYADTILPGVSEQDLVVEAWYPPGDWFETIENHGARTEVGFLSVDRSSEPNDITLYGFVHNVGQDASRIMFHHVPAYRRVPGRAVASFDEKYGLHPFYNLKLEVSEYDVPYGCQLFAQLDLPKSLFVDKYQMGDLLRSSPPMENIGVWGETDLEKPVWQTSKGSLAFFRLDGAGYNETYRIPLHSRYESPSSALHIDHVIGDPLVFWACQDQDFPKQHVPGLGVEGVFPDDTVLYVLESNKVDYRVPVIDPEPRDFVYRCTSATIIAGTLLIVFVILGQAYRQRKLKRD